MLRRLRQSGGPGLAVVVFLFLVSPLGCNRYAQIQLQNQEDPVRIRITGSDADNVYGVDPDGSSVTTPRAEIVDVSHPGNVGMWMYAGVTAAAAGTGVGTLIAQSVMDSIDAADDAVSAIGWTFLAISVAPAIGFGFYVYQNKRSKQAFAGPSSVVLTPGVVAAGSGPRGQGGCSPGLSLGVLW